MWDTKVCQHGSPGEKEALKRGYQPFATVTIPMPAPTSSLVGGQKGLNILFFMSYRKEYSDHPDAYGNIEPIWDGFASEDEDGS